METYELKQKAISGSIWSIVEKFALQIVFFIVGVILARLLGPADFGLIAMTTVFLSIFNVIMDGGFEKAIIQNQQSTQLQISSVFYLNIGLSVVLALLLFLFAPYIAGFFREPQLKNILRALSVVLPISAFGQMQRTLLMKEMNFKKVSISEIMQATVSGIVGVAMAFGGFGVWSLVISSIAGSVAWAGYYWIKPAWTPSWEFSFSSIKPMIPFGLNILASYIMLVILDQFNNFIVGKFYNKTVLGLFNRGMKFPEIITSTIHSVILKISFPLFSKVQDDGTRLKSALRKVYRLVSFIALPLIAFLFMNAHDIVIVLLTDKWIGCVLFLKMFCIIKLFSPFNSIQSGLLLARGNHKLVMYLTLFSLFIEVVPILLFIQSGIMYVLWISLFSKLIQTIIYHLLVSVKLKIPFGSFIVWILPHIAVVSIVISVVWLSGFVFPDAIQSNLILKLLKDGILGGVLYLVIGVIAKLEEWDLIKSTLFSFFGKTGRLKQV